MAVDKCLNLLKVPAKVDELCVLLQEKQKTVGTFREQYELSFNAHLNLVIIHPWVDGNGRTARLLMNYIQFYYHLFPAKIFDSLFEEGIQLVTGLRVNMKNKLMPFYDKMMLRKRYIIETINDLLKNTAQIVHSRHRSVSNFIINIISALGAYCFFDNKPKALTGYVIEDTKQLSLF